ncbi:MULTISPECIES: hypothetical protein [Noviherbaspirillum]|uniref:Uncharacterized protein n=1 Tax=Noviherbaspirillum album TaxID=3080276 RepID=A0ABU6JH62_9BURK|nr:MULTISPECIES: hypothetical protein [Noviherbaspirillum]MEC4722865.1 hypothetical protein [Noviherbaspirillum sp. CPCC 100848]
MFRTKDHQGCYDQRLPAPACQTPGWRGLDVTHAMALERGMAAVAQERA